MTAIGVIVALIVGAVGVAAGNDIERAFNPKSDTKTIRTTKNRRHGQKHTAFLSTVPFYIKQARFA